MTTETRHAACTSDEYPDALCGADDGAFTNPRETVNCPQCRVILNHVRRSFPWHAGYTDWRLTKEQARAAVSGMAADARGE